jgi:hypothetical protein
MPYASENSSLAHFVSRQDLVSCMKFMTSCLAFYCMFGLLSSWMAFFLSCNTNIFLPHDILSRLRSIDSADWTRNHVEWEWENRKKKSQFKFKGKSIVRRMSCWSCSRKEYQVMTLRAHFSCFVYHTLPWFEVLFFWKNVRRYLSVHPPPLVSPDDSVVDRDTPFDLDSFSF